MMTANLHQKELRSECNVAEGQLALIGGGAVSRRGSFTCPVKTLVLFAALQEIEFAQSEYLHDFSQILDSA
jgi:hypothetical protein